MMHLLGQMMKLPVVAFVYGVEVFVKVMRELQKTTDQSIDAMVHGIARTLGEAPNGKSDQTTMREITSAAGAAPDSPDDLTLDTMTLATSGSATGLAVTTHKEERRMPDTNLNDDTLKLVRFKILFVKRDYENAFQEREELVWENISGADFTAWKIAEFIQNMKDYELPLRWKSKKYPLNLPDDANKDKPAEERYNALHPGGKLHWLPEEDKKYLRLFFEVLQRYPRESLRYEERQIEVLEQIRDNMKK